MNHLLEVCLSITLAAGLAPTLPAQSNSDALPTLRKGISVQMPITTTAVPMPDADKEDALIVTITDDSTVYLRLDPVSPSDLAGGIREVLANQPGKNVYIKADARTPYAQVVKVLTALRNAGLEAPRLLTAQPDSHAPGTLAVPDGLQVFTGSLSSGSPSSTHTIVVQVFNSGQTAPTLKVNGDPVPSNTLPTRLAQLFQSGGRHNRDQQTVQIEADQTLPFASVVSVIDACHSGGAKIMLATPTL
jgi:biopolymer transport protein TolR